MTKEAKQTLDSMMDDMHEQIQNHPKKDDDEFKTSSYALGQATRTGEPLVFQNVQTGESSEKMSEADTMLAKENSSAFWTCWLTTASTPPLVLSVFTWLRSTMPSIRRSISMIHPTS
jgi:hypothetical protein